MKNYIPQGKDDTKYFSNLEKLSIDKVLIDVPELLTWLQDLHWDAAQGILKYFTPYVNDIKDELIKILYSNDTEWKVGAIALINAALKKLDKEILTALQFIVDHSTKDEQEWELQGIANDIIEKNSI